MPMLLHKTGKFWLHQVLFGDGMQQCGWAVYAETADELDALAIHYDLSILGRMEQSIEGFTCNIIIPVNDYNRLVGIGPEYTVHTPVSSAVVCLTAKGKIDRRTVEGRRRAKLEKLQAKK